MRLFSQRGYAATSIARIEEAAGLTPGAGGLYHHFKSKEAVLAAGILLGAKGIDERLDFLRVVQEMQGLPRRFGHSFIVVTETSL